MYPSTCYPIVYCSTSDYMPFLASPQMQYVEREPELVYYRCGYCDTVTAYYEKSDELKAFMAKGHKCPSCGGNMQEDVDDDDDEIAVPTGIARRYTPEGKLLDGCDINEDSDDEDLPESHWWEFWKK